MPNMSPEPSRLGYATLILRLGYSLTAVLVVILLASCIISYRNTISPQGIIIHHSALSRAELASFGTTNPQVVAVIHKERSLSSFYWGSWYHTGYHYMIMPDGQIQNTRPEHCRGAHTLGHNNYLGICLVGNFSSRSNPDGTQGLQKPTPAQLQSLVTLSRMLQQKYGFSCRSVFRHNDLTPRTECPGDRFPWKDVRAQLNCDAEMTASSQ